MAPAPRPNRKDQISGTRVRLHHTSSTKDYLAAQWRSETPATEELLAHKQWLPDDAGSLIPEYLTMRTIDLARNALLATALVAIAACSDPGSGAPSDSGSSSAPAAAPAMPATADDASDAADMGASAIGETLQNVADEAAELAAAGMEGVSMDGEGMQETAAELTDEAEEKAKALTEGAEQQLDAAQQAVEDMIPND